MRQSPYGFDVLRKHIQPGIDDNFDMRLNAIEIGCQCLDSR